jgi:hypothetical protein
MVTGGGLSLAGLAPPIGRLPRPSATAEGSFAEDSSRAAREAMVDASKISFNDKETPKRSCRRKIIFVIVIESTSSAKTSSSMPI